MNTTHNPQITEAQLNLILRMVRGVNKNKITNLLAPVFLADGIQFNEHVSLKTNLKKLDKECALRCITALLGAMK